MCVCVLSHFSFSGKTEESCEEREREQMQMFRLPGASSVLLNSSNELTRTNRKIFIFGRVPRLISRPKSSVVHFFGFPQKKERTNLYLSLSLSFPHARRNSRGERRTRAPSLSLARYIKRCTPNRPLRTLSTRAPFAAANSSRKTSSITSKTRSITSRFPSWKTEVFAASVSTNKTSSGN